MKSQRGKWHNGAGVGASNGSGGNAKIGTQHYNHPLDDKGLDGKAVKQLIVRQQCRRGSDGGREEGRRQTMTQGNVNKTNPF